MPALPSRLASLGFDAAFARSFSPHLEAGLAPARVLEQQRGLYRVATEDADLLAEVSGRFRHQGVLSPDGVDLPAVGDWVALDRVTGGDRAVVHAVLPRRTVLARKAAGSRSAAQVLAANVDVACLATAAAGDWNPRRLERYLALAWDAGLDPVVVVTKADLAADADALRGEVEAVAIGVPVVVASAVTGLGLEALAGHLPAGRTGILIGSSGVGKSTLVNRLLGREEQETRGLRARDGRGVHTTTARRLLPLPWGGLLVDTPGMREVSLLDEEGVDEAFSDVTALAASCRFRDCGHDTEPGCAVRAALEAGTLAPERLAAWNGLRREAAYQARRNEERRLLAERRRRRDVPRTRSRGEGRGAED